jgi:hypothetical protein
VPIHGGGAAIIVSLNRVTSALSFGPGLFRKGFACSTRIFSTFDFRADRFDFACCFQADLGRKRRGDVPDRVNAEGCLLPAYTQNFLPWSVISRPLAGPVPTVDLVVGYNKADTSPILKLFLSRIDDLIARVSSTRPATKP